MNTPTDRTRPFLRSRILHAGVFVTAMLTIALNSANAFAANLHPAGYRIAAGGDKFEGTRLFAAAFKTRPPRRLRARHLELVVGALAASAEDRAFVSFGPVWRLPIEHRSLFVELGFSPTLLAGSTLNGRDLGGNLHFTSSIAIGATFGERQTLSLSLRAQHTSNGGLNDTNPGIDMFGINIALNFTN